MVRKEGKEVKVLVGRQLEMINGCSPSTSPSRPRPDRPLSSDAVPSLSLSPPLAPRDLAAPWPLIAFWPAPWSVRESSRNRKGRLSKRRRRPLLVITTIIINDTLLSPPSWLQSCPSPFDWLTTSSHSSTHCMRRTRPFHRRRGRGRPTDHQAVVTNEQRWPTSRLGSCTGAS